MDAAKIAWKHFQNQERVVFVRCQNYKEGLICRQTDVNSVDVQDVTEQIILNKKRVMTKVKLRMRDMVDIAKRIELVILNMIIQN